MEDFERIKVNVFRQGGRPHLVAEWRDPTTGKLKRKSTGQKTRREAERYAQRMEKALNEGSFESRKTLWSEFRKQFEAAHASKWAKGTKTRYRTVLDRVESILAPRFVRGIDSAAVMKFTNDIAATGIAPTTVAAMLRHLKAALRWACRKEYLHRMPDVEMPAGTTKAGGRAVTLEEFERMVANVPKALAELKGEGKFLPSDVESFRRLLWLLWNSGLRIGEAVKLDWTDPKFITVDLSGRMPMFEIASRASKNKKHQRFYMSPECHAWLLQTPESQREGLVVLPTLGGRPIGYGTAVKVVALIGKVTGVKVGTDHAENPTFASAHDLRRSFATRWAAKVTPGVLQAMMRHSSPSTTAQFYTDRSAEPIGDAIWGTVKPESEPVPIVTTITK